MKAPICEKCGKYCNPSGGIIGTSIKFWKCFGCGYEVEDAEFKDLDEVESLHNLKNRNEGDRWNLIQGGECLVPLSKKHIFESNIKLIS